MATSLDDISDKELFEKIEEAHLVERLESDPAFNLLKVAASRIVDKAIMEFTKTAPDDAMAIAQLQIIIKKYKWNLFNEINLIKQESKLVYEEARDRGVIGNFLEGIKQKIGM